MAFVEAADVGTTRRKRLSPSRRLQVWESTGGVCILCRRVIDGVRERWIAEHVRALELGGDDNLSNMGPAHTFCAREKTRTDHASAARAKRQKIRHIGASCAERPLPFGRQSPLKRKLNGTIVRRWSEEGFD
jgi:5-methylcytosine-specific restriction endonuclease McrA